MCALAPIANNVVARDAVGYAGSSQTKADDVCSNEHKDLQNWKDGAAIAYCW
ncbi:hypothetical protein IC582_016094 [Cucumis melo]